MGGLRVQEIAAHVHVHPPVVVGQGRVKQACLNPDPGVVNQHIEASELPYRQVHRAGHRIWIASVSRHEPGLPGHTERFLRTKAQLLIPSGYHHGRALAQEPVRDRIADAARATGDQRVLAL